MKHAMKPGKLAVNFYQDKPLPGFYEQAGIEKDDTPRRSREDSVKFRRNKAVPSRVKQVIYNFDPSKAILPMVGESVAVCHRTSDKKDGALEVRTDVTHRTIRRVYLSDEHGYSIQDHVGDVWHVRPASLGGSKWETFRPGETQKVVTRGGR